jgi:hypothetical protein
VIASEPEASQKCVAMAVLMTSVSKLTSFQMIIFSSFLHTAMSTWQLSDRALYWALACSLTLTDVFKSNLKLVEMGRKSSFLATRFSFFVTEEFDS